MADPVRRRRLHPEPAARPARGVRGPPARARARGPARRRARRVWALVPRRRLALASPLFFLRSSQRRTSPPTRRRAAHAMGIGKALGLLLDPELGLVRYAPLTVALLAVARGRRGPPSVPRVEGALVGRARAHDAALLGHRELEPRHHGPQPLRRLDVSRDRVLAHAGSDGDAISWRAPRRTWSGPARRRRARAGRGGRGARRGAVAARLPRALRGWRAPSWTAGPRPTSRLEVFRERTAHTEADLDGPFIHERDGRCRKALARWKHADALRARCGPIPDAVRPFFESRPPKEEKSRWVYVDYSAILTAACASYPSRDG